MERKTNVAEIGLLKCLGFSAANFAPYCSFWDVCDEEHSCYK
jgi:hypothetical protein